MAERPEQVLKWAVEMFGENATTLPERVRRFTEEALELVHAANLELSTLHALVDRVYSRPAGEVAVEVGQVQLTFELLTHVLGIDADAEADREVARIMLIPKEEWQRRHAAKIAKGLGT